MEDVLLLLLLLLFVLRFLDITPIREVISFRALSSSLRVGKTNVNDVLLLLLISSPLAEAAAPVAATKILSNDLECDAGLT